MTRLIHRPAAAPVLRPPCAAGRGIGSRRAKRGPGTGPSRVLTPLAWIAATAAVASCAVPGAPPSPQPQQPPPGVERPVVVDVPARPLARLRLDPGIAYLTPRQQSMLVHLMEAAAWMDEIFWLQSYGDPRPLLSAIQDPGARQRVTINYGPWDRYQANRQFVEGAGDKPPGAALYPPDMTRHEFEAAALPDKQDPLTVIRRHADGSLLAVPYRFAYRAPLEQAARQMALAADLSDDPYFKRYLTLRARALITDDYGPSDSAWAGLRHNSLDLVIGPVDHREDLLFGYKSAYAAWVLIRDRAVSTRLERVVSLLPRIRADLPAAPMYRAELRSPPAVPGAFDALFAAGAANAGPKASVLELPGQSAGDGGDGRRRIYLRNVMRAQFDSIVLPTAVEMIVEDQRQQVSFEDYYGNLLLAELGRAISPRETVSGQPLQPALRERYAIVEDALADVLGLFIQQWLQEHEPAAEDGDTDYLVTFTAALLRDIRLGNGSPRATSRAVEFNYLKAFDALSRDAATGRYRVHPEAARAAVSTLVSQLLVIAGNGDYAAAGSLIEAMGEIEPLLRQDLVRLDPAVPVDLVFEQGPQVLGLE